MYVCICVYYRQFIVTNSVPHNYTSEKVTFYLGVLLYEVSLKIIELIHSLSACPQITLSWHLIYLMSHLIFINAAAPSHLTSQQACPSVHTNVPSTLRSVAPTNARPPRVCAGNIVRV